MKKVLIASFIFLFNIVAFGQATDAEIQEKAERYENAREIFKPRFPGDHMRFELADNNSEDLPVAESEIDDCSCLLISQRHMNERPKSLPSEVVIPENAILMSERPTNLIEVFVLQDVILNYPVIVEDGVLPYEDMRYAQVKNWPMEGFKIDVTIEEIAILIDILGVRTYDELIVASYQKDSPFGIGVEPNRGSFVRYTLTTLSQSWRKMDDVVLITSIRPILNISKQEFREAKRLLKKS
jgi:hypothetical protein